jgi:DNA-binding CsgD family transcriptional regulator
LSNRTKTGTVPYESGLKRLLARHLSFKTAVFHKSAIMDKLGLRTTAELTHYAIENKIVPAK